MWRINKKLVTSMYFLELFLNDSSEVKTQLLEIGFEETQIDDAIELTRSEDLQTLIDAMLGKCIIEKVF